ncbi:hypothetical protein [Nonlabens antarcticus]|uniref:hypothetical protein n=1 Tax=Nonlabens antarcticus TaxID=392714 RepID=UPI001890DF5D|nr:hypothetical protein [Nonlabens antarcticus]
MKKLDFNICPACMHKETCVLTHEKSQVWSCSDFDEKVATANLQPQKNNLQKKRLQQMATA